MSRPMGKPTICIGENKSADQLRGNREADQRLCFHYLDSAIPLLLKTKISSFQLFSVLVQPDLCLTCSETTLLVFPTRQLMYHTQRNYFDLSSNDILNHSLVRQTREAQDQNLLPLVYEAS